MYRFSEWITSHPKLIAFISFLLLIPSVIGFASTGVNYDILSYLPDDLESVEGEQILDNTFGIASSAMLVLENMPQRDVAALKEKIAEIDGVSQVTWSDSIADISIPKEMLPEVMTSIFYSSDGTSTLMLINFTESSASDKTMSAIQEIRKQVNKQCFLSGLSVILLDTKELADSQAPIFVAIAVVLALIVMSFTMESWILPLILLLALGMAVIYNMGTNIIFGEISYITQCIAAILQLGVTMDYSVFLIDRFHEETGKGGDRQKAMAKAVRKTFTSLLGSSLTTVFGFLALCFMSLTLGMDIGLVMAKGVLLGIITVVIVLPALVLLFYNAIERFHHKRLVPNFSKLNSFTLKHRKAVVAVFVILMIPSLFGAMNVEKYYNMDRALPQDLGSISALNKLKDDFDMASTHFVIVDKSVPQSDVSKMVGEFEKLDGINGVISLASFVGPGVSEDIIPDSIKQIAEQGDYRLMMVNSSYGVATDESNEQVDKMNSIIKKYDETGFLTGEPAMTKDLVEITERDFTVTSIISVAAIFALIAVIFKSLSIPVLLVGLIESAILMNEACSFYTSTVISFIAPTVISCIQLGATVDYAILLSTRFKEELDKGLDKKSAVLNAANTSCESIFQSALVFFSATIGVYFCCDIELIKGICAMLARGSVISALIIIFVLPPLLYMTEGIISRTTLKWKKRGKEVLSNEK